jgi:hypothetical protein
MANEVHVTASQADAAKLILERNSANGRATPEAIRKIAEAQPDHAPAASNQDHATVTVRGRKNRRLRALIARMISGRAAAEGQGSNS